MRRPPLVRRNAALAKTLAKYQGQKLVWGKTDCLRMLRSHLVAMGHKGLPKIPPYKDEKGALRALAQAGGSLEGILDKVLPRVAPAAMLPGDVALMQGDGPLDAIVICVGRKVVGFHQDMEEAVIMIPHEIKAAWHG